MKKLTEKIVLSAAALSSALCILIASAPAVYAAALEDRPHAARQEITLAALLGDESEGTYTLTVDGIAESHQPGNVIQLSAPFYTSDGLAHRFSHWTGNTYLFADSTASDISFIMPQSAVTLNRNYVIVGDADGDGIITAADSLYIRKMVEGLILPTLAADINLDGKWDNEDLALIRQMLIEIYIPTK